MSSLSQTVDDGAKIYPFVQKKIHFDLAPIINVHLQRAASMATSRVMASNPSLVALLTAHESAPDQLEVLIALSHIDQTQEQ